MTEKTMTTIPKIPTPISITGAIISAIIDLIVGLYTASKSVLRIK